MFSLFAKTLSLVFVVFGVSMIPPLAVSLAMSDGAAITYSVLLVVALVLGLPAFVFEVPGSRPARIRDGFIIVTMTWLGICSVGALPFIIIGGLDTASALFESASGFTTTGSTTIVDLDLLPRSLLLYRQEIQWVGGIGVIVLAIALLPMLGIGGLDVLKAETTGPAKSDKLRPRLKHTAQAMWGIYFSITLLCALMYWLAGMPAFEAIAHSLSTVSTGGFSTHDESLAYYASPAIEAVAITFMLLGATSFVLHYRAWAQRSVKPYGGNAEARVFVFSIIILSGIVAAFLALNVGDTSLHSLRLSVFEVVSVITSTGFGVADFTTWPLMLPSLLIFISFVGGCSGSTAGGMKVIRFTLMGRQAGIEIARLVHPRIVRPLKLNGVVVPESVIQSVWAFFTVYIVVFGALMLLLMWFGLDQVSAFGAIATCLNNLGPGLGEVANNFATVSPAVKLVCGLACIMGRLEIFTVFVLCTPTYWRA
jgi:trk system potassium uptake protein TrkH